MFSKWKGHALRDNPAELREQQALPIRGGQGLEKRFASFRLVSTKHAKTERPGNLNAGTVLPGEPCPTPGRLRVFPTSARTTRVPADKGCSAAHLVHRREAAAEQGKDSPQIHWRIHKFVSDPESDGWKSRDACYSHVSDLKSGEINGFGWNIL